MKLEILPHVPQVERSWNSLLPACPQPREEWICGWICLSLLPRRRRGEKERMMKGKTSLSNSQSPPMHRKA